LSLDGRPLQVYEDDHEVPWPNHSKEQWTVRGSPPRSITPPPSASTMPYIIPVVRFIPQLKKTLKSATIAPATVDTYDDYFRSILRSYPEALQPAHRDPLEPHWLQAVLPLQAARLLLYRHNLTTLCSPRERADALARCLAPAYDTLRYIRRCLGTSPDGGDEREEEAEEEEAPVPAALAESIRFQADNFVCKHVWRTTLMLCYRGDYRAAAACARYSAAVGDVRKVNIACGRNLSFLLERLRERERDGSGGAQGRLDVVDEELAAYASGDLQGDADNAWVWAGSEAADDAGPGPAPAPVPGGAPGAPAGPGPTAEQQQEPKTALLTESELQDWGGWGRVRRLLAELAAERERQGREAHPYLAPAHNAGKRLHLAPRDDAPAAGTSTPPAGASRISIANII
jgi:hypothetical protein